MSSIIYQMERDSLEKLVKDSKTYSQILKAFGLENVGNNHRTLKKRLDEDNIDYSHINTKLGGWNKGLTREIVSKEVALERFFKKENPNVNSVRRYLKKFQYKPYLCSSCNNNGSWQSKSLSLELDHIDGERSNNELENLRWLCPNCHSQTANFRGRKRKKERPKCQNSSWRSEPRPDARKVKRPEKEELAILIMKKSIADIARDNKVSANTVRKWLKCYKLEKPKFPKGYWLMKDKVVHPARLELATHALKGRCSTIELRVENTKNI